jgi:hypothetical protein
LPLLNISSTEIGIEAVPSVEHFKLNMMQDGMDCLCCAPDAERVSTTKYESFFRRRIQPEWISSIELNVGVVQRLIFRRVGEKIFHQ